MISCLTSFLASSVRWLDGQLKPPVLETAAAKFAEREAGSPPEMSDAEVDQFLKDEAAIDRFAAERLAEREAEEEVSEPSGDGAALGLYMGSRPINDVAREWERDRAQPPSIPAMANDLRYIANLLDPPK